MPIYKNTQTLEEAKLENKPPQGKSPWYVSWSNNEYDYNKFSKEDINYQKKFVTKMMKDLKFKHTYDDWLNKKEYLTDTQLKQITDTYGKEWWKQFEPKKESKDKMKSHMKTLNDNIKLNDKNLKAVKKNLDESNTKSKVEKLLKKAKALEIPKGVSSELVSMILDIVETVVKAPKTKFIETKSIQNQLNELEKLMKTPKNTLQNYKDMRMDQKAYKKKVSNVEPHIANYVAIYKELLNKDNKGGARTRAINNHISNFMKDARPSDISTANALIREFKEAQPKVEAPTKVKKASAPKNLQEKKYKSVTTYVKKNKPSLNDDEIIHLIVIDLINEDKRMSKKLLDKVLKDYEID